MRVTVKGQVTIPKAIREKLGIRPYSEIDFFEESERVYIRFDRVRGSATVRMTTEEILRLTRGDP